MSTRVVAWLACLLSVIVALAGQAGEVTLAWEAPTEYADGSPLTELTGYRVYYGTSSGAYEGYRQAGLNTSLTVSNLRGGVTHYLTVTVLDSLGTESDFADEVAWSTNELAPPVVTRDPSSASVAELTPISFTVSVSGDAPLSYQWRRDGTNIPGGTGESYEFAASTIAADDGARFDVVIANPYGCATSGVATLSVLTAAQAERRPTLSWDEVPGASYYYVWIERDGKTYYRKWLRQTETTWTPDWGFKGGSYRWWVRPWVASIGRGPWVEGDAFDISVQVPTRATPVSPCGALDEGEVCFTCDPSDGATWYYFWVNKSGSRYLRKWVPQDPSYSVSDLPFGSYKWWVRPWNPDGYGDWSQAASFFYGVSAPVAPEGTLETRLPVFSWTQVEEAEWYYVWVNKDGSKYMRKWVHASTNWTPETELAGGEYTWWVKGWSSDRGHGPWSASGSFDIEEDQPEAVELVAPLEGTEGSAVEYAWNADDAATWYHLRIRCDGEDWYSKWLKTGIESGQLTVTVDGHLSGAAYTWSVRGYGPDGLGPWSEEVSFEVE